MAADPIRGIKRRPNEAAAPITSRYLLRLRQYGNMVGANPNLEVRYWVRS
jgi:hypothetical protein